MKKANFNTLKNLPVPEQWIEKALAIPETEEQKPVAVPFWKKPRFIATAASLVLVSALSVGLFLTIGGKSPVAVKPSSTEIVWTTDANGETVATEIVVVPADNDRQDGTQPTEQKSGIVRFFERIFGIDDNTAPTTAPGSGRGGRTSPTESGRTVPTTKQVPTESGTPSVKPTESDDPAEPPTEATTEDNGEVIIHGPGGWEYEKPTKSPDPTISPTESPAPHPTTPPTATPWVNPTEPSWENPTTPAQPNPTQSRYKESIVINYVSTFTISAINKDGGAVYCRIYDSSGNSYGDSDRYSDQHLAALSLTYDSRTLSYTPRDYGILPEDGYYSYEFYTRSGKSLITGNAYLSAT